MGDSKDLRGTSLQIAMFTDHGAAWNEGEDPDYLHSVGVGILWRYKQRYDAALYVAHDLEEVEAKQDYDLQDDGIHFRFGINL
jgi:hemolysin activation/secretion protein